MIVLVNHLIHETELEVTPRSYLFCGLCQAVNHVHLIYPRSHPDVQDAVRIPDIPVRIIFSVNEEGHRLYGIVVAETAETNILTESDHRIITKSSGFVHLHPGIFLPGCFVENIHISVARFKVPPLSNLDAKHR